MNLGNYSWLLNEPGPKMILEGIAIYGTKEVIGSGDNPTILAWAREVGLEYEYRHDSVAWCGLAMAVVAQRAGKPVVAEPLWALHWADWGRRVNDGAKLGDVLTFKRVGGGHVGIYIGEDDLHFHVMGGNEEDQFTIIPMEKSRLYAIRRPPYMVQPVNVRQILLNTDGTLKKVE